MAQATSDLVEKMTKGIKILEINKFYSPHIGGMETVLKQYSEFLSEEFEVTVLTCHDKFCWRTTKEEIQGVQVIRCSTLGVVWSMPISLSFIWYFFKYSGESDAVHFHEPFPMGTLAGMMLSKGKKIIITWHCDIVRQRFVRTIVERMQRTLCRRANIITTTSETLKTRSRVLRDFSGKVIVVPLSIDERQYLKITDRDLELGMALPEAFGLYFGRLVHYKGIRVLVDAMENAGQQCLPLIIAGTGPEENYVRDAISKGTNVVFVNRRISEEEKILLLQMCSYFVFPSIQPSEAFGIVQLEAMALGKPVINTNLPTGVPWVSLDGVSGLTVPVGDQHALRLAMEKLTIDSELRREYGANGKIRVKEMFSDKLVKRKIKNLIGSLVGQHSDQRDSQRIS